MNRGHALIISLLLAAAVVAGVLALTRSGDPASASVRSGEIAARQAKLDAWQRELEAALAKKPPTLPALPQRGTSSAAADRVVYVRESGSSAGRGEDDHGEEHEADEQESEHGEEGGDD